MVYKLIFKKRFRNKLETLLIYLEKEFGLLIAQRFVQRLEKKLEVIRKQPLVGSKSSTIKNVRSFLLGKRNRTYYRIEKDTIVVLNLYDTRINPAKNKLR